MAVAEWRKPGRRCSDADPESQGDQHGSAGAAASLGGMFFGVTGKQHSATSQRCLRANAAQTQVMGCSRVPPSPGHGWGMVFSFASSSSSPLRWENPSRRELTGFSRWCPADPSRSPSSALP